MATEVLAFSQSIDAGETGRQRRRISHTGRLSSLHFNFPSTSNLLDVRVNTISGSKTSQIIPAETGVFLSWADATLNLGELGIELQEGSELVLEWTNRSGGSLNCPVVAVVTTT